MNNMEPIITVNEYPIGWEWLDRVPLEDFTWLIEIFSTITDNTDTYDFATFDKEATNGEPPYPVIEIDRKGLAYIMSTYHIGTHDLDIRDVLKSYIIARYYGWEPKEEDLEEIISNTPYFNFNVDDAIYEVLTMPREEITI
nr:MAG: hypothetical protein [Bacteriophage sp.]